jgi:hypothetical protein
LQYKKINDIIEQNKYKNKNKIMNVIENKNVSLENISPEQEADNIFNSAVDIYSELTEAYK